MSDLYSMQAAPLSVKIKMTARRIRDWVDEFGQDGVYVSFSGGKDSTVLVDIVRNVCGYKKIPLIFVDVPTQYPELKEEVEKMNELLQRIANYFAYQYKGNDKIAPKMDMSVDDLRNITALHIEKCRLETKLRNLQQIKTNADRIRNMSDEELAEFLAYNAYCEECYVKKDDSCCYPNGTCKQKTS